MPDTLASSSENWRSQPERVADLEQHYKAGLSFQADRARLIRTRSRLLGGLLAATMTIVVAQSVAIAWLVPSQRLVPMMLVIQPDGTVDSYAAITSLPATQEQAVIRAALWKYVRDRESYNFADAPGRYAFVSAISAPPVRDAYQRWFLPQFNKMTPQATVGRKGQIDVEKISMVFPNPTVAIVRFRRSLEFYGQKPTVTTWTATAEFEVSSRLPGGARDEGDPGGIVVVRYTSGEDSP
jgi:type IV secretion system protein VirB8